MTTLRLPWFLAPLPPLLMIVSLFVATTRGTLAQTDTPIPTAIPPTSTAIATASLAPTATLASTSTLAPTATLAPTGTTAATPTTVALPDLAVSMNVSSNPAQSGQTLTYYITVQNVGGTASPPTTLIDTVPDGTTLATVDPNCSYDSTNVTVVCRVAPLSPQGNQPFTLSTTVSATSGVITNTAIVDPQNFINEASNFNNVATITVGVIPGTITPGTATPTSVAGPTAEIIVVTATPLPVQAPPTAEPPAPAPVPEAQGPCYFELGFAALHDLIPDIVGDCLDNEMHGANGDGLQHTTDGLMAWRKADNWTAFTDGANTWINGPFGISTRPNDVRFSWEGDANQFPNIPDQ